MICNIRDAVFEVTRRGNLNCAHCERGASEAVDLKEEYVDAFLKQLNGGHIGRLTFSGGEPTLNPDIIIYTLEQLKKQLIMPGTISMITNGQVFNKELAEAFYDYAMAVKERYMIGDEFDINSAIQLGFSVDRFHPAISKEVRDGYRKLGFLGGMEAAAVIRFGYGYVQGVNAAAEEIKEPVDLNYVYGGQFFGDSEIFKYIDNWYKVDQTEVVFACGGSIYTSVALAAKENNGKMIGVDSDQSPIIDRDYGQDICITSAMKGIRQTVVSKLEDLYNEHIWQGGTIEYLGLNSKVDPDENYVQLAPSTWELGKERMTKFTLEDYQELVGYLIDNPDAVSSDIDHEPALGSYLKVSYKGTIK